MPDPASTDRLFAAFPPVSDEEWLAAIERDLKGKRFEDVLVWKPLEGFPVQPFYRRPPDPGKPVIPPLRAGWTLRQDIPGDAPADVARRARQALDQGAEALGVTIRSGDTPGPGLAFPEAAAFRAWLTPFRTVPLHIDADGPPGPLLAAWLDMAGPNAHGTWMWDPLARGARRGRLPAPAAFDALAHLLTQTEPSSSVRVLGIDLEPYHEAGASATQELAVLLAATHTYAGALTDRGLSPRHVAHHLHVRVPVGTSYFMEIAKMRALRRLLGQVLAAYDAEAGRVPVLVQAVTSRRSMTLYDPYVNMLRATTQAAAAILGGTDTLTVRPYNELYGRPDDFGMRIARNTQLILRHEAYLNRVVDPAAGSYYVEHLTDALGGQAWSLFQAIEARGGLMDVLRAGWLQQQIDATRQARARQLAERRRVLVGTNQYPNTEERLPDEILFAAPGIDTPAERSTDAPFDGDPIAPLPPFREAEPFERLRRRTEAYAAAHGHTPMVYLLPFGHRALRSARAHFARNFFGCAGFVIDEGDGFDNPRAAAEALTGVQADVVVLCSADDAYRDAAPVLLPVIRQAAPGTVVVVAGYPEDDLDALREAGVDDFVHLRSPVLETLEAYQQRLGIGEAA
ncbi:hypothetical protein AWN76_003260 [Rhodothermaceae bacterium RA]|nr:hypothetical protein AWN76_003260 [Rhodothermaceae bacterium RA]